jgi:putative peptidoglycan lipid II flippase
MFQLLFANYFGASLLTDSFFISIILIDFISKIELSFTEMFIQYYNDLRFHDTNQGKIFYQAVFNFSLLAGLITFLVAILFSNSIVRLFISSFNSERMMYLTSVFTILAFTLIWNRLKEINNSLINAEMRFIFPYLVSLLSPMSNIASLLVFSTNYGIYPIAISILFSDLVILLIQQIYISKVIKIRYGKIFWHYKFKDLIKNSISLRIGNQLWELKDLIAANILSFLPPGTVSLYLYGSRIITILFVITTFPSLQVFFSTVSRLASEKKFSSIRMLSHRTLKGTLFLFLISIALFSILLPKLMLFLLGQKLSTSDIQIIYYIFLALIPFYVILSIELPFVNIITAMKDSLKIIKVNLAFIAIFYICAVLLKNDFGIYAIPCSLMVAQSQSFVLYVVNVQKLFKQTTN